MKSYTKRLLMPTPKCASPRSTAGWPVSKTGERLTFIHKPDLSLQVNVIGATKGVIKGGDFAKVFLAIWLGADPPNPEIKAGMLGCPLRVVTTC
jgi:hypothetical protein